MSKVAYLMRANGTSFGRAGLIAGAVSLIGGLVLLGLGAWPRLLSFASPPQFHANVLVRTEPGRTGDAATNAVPYDFYGLQTEYEFLRSAVILNPAISNLDLPRAWGLGVSDCRDLVKERLDLKLQPGTNTIELIVGDNDRWQTARLANAIAASYANFYERQWAEATAALSNAAVAQVSALDAQIKALDAKVSRLKADLGIAEPASAATNRASSRFRLPDAAADKESQVVREERVLASLKAMDRAQLRGALPGASGDRQFVSMLKELDRAEIDLTTLKQDHPADAPEVVRAQGQFDALQQKIDTRAEGILVSMETHISVLKDEIKQDEAKTQQAQRAVLLTADKQRPYYAALDDLRDLQKRRQSIQAEASTVSTPRTRLVEILRRAEPPADAPAANVILRPALLCAGALLAAGGLVLILRNRRSTISAR